MKMRRLLYAVLATAVLGYAYSSSGANAMQNGGQGSNGDRVAFYKVPLECHAAPGIGCGSLSKPILMDLESRPIVKEAWLDRHGKTLAIVWKEGAAHAERAIVVVAVGKAHNLSPEELTAGARDIALASFRSGGGWHRGADVDRLSEEEAGVIADRLVLRVSAKAPTISPKAELLRPIMADIIRDCLVGSPDPSSARCRETFAEDLITVMGEHLSGAETHALREAAKAGFRPLDGER
jgi:hypothetical protein